MTFPSAQKAGAAAMALLCLLTAAMYVPSLSSGLYMDDYYNLRLLEKVATDGYAAYIFSGVSGPTGRPLSLLSFALQHGSWPDQLAALKAVNLLLHLLNGLLVFLVIRRAVAPRGAGSTGAVFLAAGTAGLWLLHPMHVSTVLYIVQRMTQWSALFVLLGSLGYLHGRLLIRDRAPRGYALMSFSLVLGTVLAVLSKENGALLPLLVLVMDFTLLREWPAPPGYARWRGLFLIVPSALIGLYLLKVALFGSSGFAGRSYTMYQKTLTEAAVLIQYLRDLILPHPGAFGLFHDDFPVSRGLLDPPATLIAVLAIVSAVVAAVLLRRRCAPLAFGLLWFFAAHLLESTHLNLALYFEHRNYLPAVGILFLLTWGCAAVARRYARRGQVAAAAALYCALLAWSGFATASLWRDPMLMAIEAVRNHPDSPGALVTLGNHYLGAGEIRSAMRVFEDMEAKFPGEIYPPLKQVIVAACVTGSAVPESRWEEIRRKARQGAPPAFEFLAELDTVIYEISRGHCGSLDQDGLLRLMETLAQNPAFRRERGGLLQLAANLRMERFEFTEAHADLVAAVRASPTIERQLQLLALELAMKRPQEAEKTLAGLERRLARNPLARPAYADRLQRYRERLQTLQQIP
ncbi:MAG: hypothetical protein HYY48_05740 [Gammaproteobacteria bacterium]|nr:hypothetical protein [Gammaproteobacteria bacterium]